MLLPTDSRLPAARLVGVQAMIVSNPVRVRRDAGVSARSALSTPAEQRPCFRDPRRRVILGTPDPAPCPFCARRDALIIVADLSLLDVPPRYHVNCGRCGAEGPQARSRRAAAALWNTLGVSAEQRFYRLLCGPGEA